MSQLSLNQNIQSLVTDPESAKKKGILKNSENHSKKRPSSGLASNKDDNVSIATTNNGDFTRVRKLGYLPSYLKKITKSSVESELVTKYRKFKLAKKDLVEQQSNLMKNFEQLRVLKEKFKQFGGRDFKLENLEVIEFNGGVKENVCGEPHSTNSQIFEFEREIQRIRGRVKDCLFKLIELNSDAIKQIQASGTEELQCKIQDIFLKVDEYVKSVNSEQDMSMQLLLENLQHLRNPLPQGMQPSINSTRQDDEIVGLKKAIQNLEIQGKMLQSEIDVKNREIEYLKSKEIDCSNTKENCSNNNRNDKEENCELRTEILAQKDLINDYRNQLNEQLKLQETLEGKVKQLEDKVEQQNRQMEVSLSKFKKDLSEEQQRCVELGQLLEETKNANSKIVQRSDSTFELISNQLSAANEDIKELQFTITKRDKQIQNLRQTINLESNKMKDYDQLFIKYDQLRQQDLYKSKEINQLKEKLVVRGDTINSQIATISELNQRIMAHSANSGGAAYSNDNSIDPLHSEQLSKFSDHERIIKKLENNKIRSNMLRDQLLDRISMLEKENEDMKGQIRKFHEDFTINRFMYDEQRRKKRLTEILVKQYQK